MLLAENGVHSTKILCDKSAKLFGPLGRWQGRVDFALPVRLCNEHIQFSFLPCCSAYGTGTKSGSSNIGEDRGCCHVMFHVHILSLLHGALGNSFTSAIPPGFPGARMLTDVRRRALAYPTVFGHTRNRLGAGAEPGVCGPAASQGKNEPELVEPRGLMSGRLLHSSSSVVAPSHGKVRYHHIRDSRTRGSQGESRFIPMAELRPDISRFVSFMHTC